MGLLDENLQRIATPMKDNLDNKSGKFWQTNGFWRRFFLICPCAMYCRFDRYSFQRIN